MHSWCAGEECDAKQHASRRACWEAEADAGRASTIFSPFFLTASCFLPTLGPAVSGRCLKYRLLEAWFCQLSESLSNAFSARLLLDTLKWPREVDGAALFMAENNELQSCFLSCR